ncbi:MAG: DUF4271 domain-containing protein [Flavobacteriales bacterium]|nr:DUF4271 domain-containing protein [Flavobacteriales bacterium]
MEWIESVVHDRDPWFISFGLILLLLGAIRQSEGARLRIFLRSFLNPSLLIQQVRQERAYNRVTLPILLIVIAVIGLFVFQVLHHFALMEMDAFMNGLSAVVGVIVGVTILRSIAYLGFALTFGLMGTYRLHNLQWLLHNFILALFLLPISIVIAFGPMQWATPLVYIGLGALLLTYLIRAFRLFGMAQSDIHTPWVYNVLYLCALEIMPPILVVVSVLRQAEG